LYRLACESGLRSNELRNLRISDFDFNDNVVVLGARHAKNRKPVRLPLRPDTAKELQGLFDGKLPGCNAFNMPGEDRMAMMLRADLADTQIEYETDAGVFDFHALRGQCGTLLAATGCHPKTIQAILRHSDINLSLSVYTHSLRGAESEAVKRLPDLSSPSSQSQKKTGTDDMSAAETVLASCLALSCAGQRPTMPSGEKQGRVTGRHRNDNTLRSGAEKVDSGHFTGEQKETGERGFEPRLTDPESVVLPLHYSPKTHFSKPPLTLHSTNRQCKKIRDHLTSPKCEIDRASQC